MPSSYAGAVAAIRERLQANWTTTPIAFQNERFTHPTDPISGEGAPWVYLEVIGNYSELRGAGTPGDNIWCYDGHILIHVFVPVNSGVELAQQLAVAAGEIFRAAGFYNDGQGSIVRSWSPQTDGGGISDDDGNWFRVTCTIPFEYFHRG